MKNFWLFSCLHMGEWFPTYCFFYKTIKSKEQYWRYILLKVTELCLFWMRVKNLKNKKKNKKKENAHTHTHMEIYLRTLRHLT